METIENKSPLEGLDKLITQGSALLDGQDAVSTHDDYNSWVSDVSQWLNKRFPDSGLSGSWVAQGDSVLVLGNHYNESPTSWMLFKRMVRQRLQWLGKLPQERKVKSFLSSVPSVPSVTPQKQVEFIHKEIEIIFPPNRSKVFIVHGRDDLAKIETARFIEKLGLTAIILHEQANSGKTIIEKIEEHTNVGFGIVLYTPCDIGGLDVDSLKPRGRQNVVFEHGYLIAKLGRENVCALVKGDIEIPNDISGVVYIDLDDRGAWRLEIARELSNAGYDIDIKKLFK
jgi:predicted nucleotide-binding protein